MTDFNIDKLKFQGGEPKADGYSAMNGGLGMGIHLDLDDVVYGHRDAREQLDVLRAKVKALEDENANLRKDAGRYRWLRERDLGTIKRGGVFAGMTPGNYVLNQEDLDLEIDSAIAKQEKEDECCKTI